MTGPVQRFKLGDWIRLVVTSDQEQGTDMKCACGNAGRYINERSEICCGICPIEQGLDSIKLSEVGTLLQWARAIDCGGFMNGDSFGALRSIIGRKPLVSR